MILFCLSFHFIIKFPEITKEAFIIFLSLHINRLQISKRSEFEKRKRELGIENKSRYFLMQNKLRISSKEFIDKHTSFKNFFKNTFSKISYLL